MMNHHVLWGTVTFVLWSTFSTWYYINYIKVFEGEKPAKSVVITESLKRPDTTFQKTELEDTLTLKKEEVILPVSVEKNFLFIKNTDDLSQPDQMKSFVDSIQQNLKSVAINIQITGYTCDLGEANYNMRLSQRRAESVAAYMKTKIDFPIQIDFKGESNPVSPNTTEDNRTKNRRVEVTIKSSSL